MQSTGVKHMKIRKKVRREFFVRSLLVVSLVCSQWTVSSAKAAPSLNKTKITLEKGESFLLKLKNISKKKKKTAVWSVSNKKIISVTSKGMVKAKKKGKATVWVKVKGRKQKLKCVVKVVAANQQPQSTEANSQPAPSAGATALPQGTGTPVPSADATVSPIITEIPGTTGTTDVTESPGTSGEPLASKSPTPTDIPAEEFVLPLVDRRVMEIDGEVMTVYLLDKTYNGSIHISFCGVEYTADGSVKDALVLLKSTYTTKTNSANTLTMSRAQGEAYWTITVLTSGQTYYMRAESKQSIDSSLSDCGALYFKGDVSSLIQVY